MNAKYLGENVNNYLNDNLSYGNFTGSAALSALIVAPNSAHRWTLEEIRLTLTSAAGTGLLTITLDSSSGSAYDTVLLSQQMSGYTYLRYASDKPIYLQASDKVYVEWDNAGMILYGLETISNIKWALEG